MKNTLEELTAMTRSEIEYLVSEKLNMELRDEDDWYNITTSPSLYMSLVTIYKINIEFDDNRDAVWCLVRNNSKCESTNDFPVEELGTAVCISFLLSAKKPGS